MKEQSPSSLIKCSLCLFFSARPRTLKLLKGRVCHHICGFKMRKREHSVAAGFYFLQAATAHRIATPFIKLTCPRLGVTSSDFCHSSHLQQWDNNKKDYQGLEALPCKFSKSFSDFRQLCGKHNWNEMQFPMLSWDKSSLFVVMSACQPLLWQTAVYVDCKWEEWTCTRLWLYKCVFIHCTNHLELCWHWAQR